MSISAKFVANRPSGGEGRSRDASASSRIARATNSATTMTGAMPGPIPDDDDEPGLVAKGQAGDNAAPLSITEISNLLKRTVEDRFGFVRLRGELSGVKRAASGHLYCSLKDEGAVIDGVMWKGGAQRLAFVPEDGIEVVASGKLTTYPGRSKYQIVIETMLLEVGEHVGQEAHLLPHGSSLEISVPGCPGKRRA